MQKSHIVAALAVVLSLAGVATARAGFTVQSSVLQVANTDIGTPGGSVGDSFSIGGSVFSADGTAGGSFATYLADTPLDPQIAAGDLGLYRFNLSGSIAGVLANVVTYDGDYSLFYDQNGDGEPNEGLIVSSGDFAGTATFLTGETATFVGTLTQTTGPSNPAFRDLSYGGSPIELTGEYADTVIGDGPSPTGTLTATLRQNAIAIPEPATLSLVGVALAAFGLRRRSLR
jgi:hypothetical protein